MATHNDTCSHCLQLQQRAEESAVLEPVIMKCHAGLTEAAVPVRVGDNVIAHLLTGQIHLRSPDKAVFEEFRRTLGLGHSRAETARLRAAYFASRQLTRKQFESLVRLLGVFAQHLGAISSQVLVQENSSESPVVAKARAFIHERFASQISVNDAARNVHMSTFHFCKVFKSGTGLTFTEYLARLRVEYVKQQMLNPHLRVSEAAFAAGFQSLSQFNRVFRRIAGESPRDYRARVITNPPADPAHAA